MGYLHCPLIYEHHIEKVDNQGGACDYDVHEHFKCLEETLLKKAFVIIGDNYLKGYNCNIAFKDNVYVVDFFEECDFIHVNSKTKIEFLANNRKYVVDSGLHLIKF